MDLQQIKEWLEANKGESGVAEFVASLSADKKVDAAAVQAWATTPEGNAWLTSEKDKHFAKGLETWKSNQLPGLIEAELQKANTTETEEMKQIRELKKQLEERDTAAKRQEILNKALKAAEEKKIPAYFVERFIGEDEESTMKNLDDLASQFETVVSSKVESTFKDNGYKPGKAGGKGSETAKTPAEIAAGVNIRNK